MPERKPRLFRRAVVYERVPGGVMRYVCLEDAGSRRFAVSNADLLTLDAGAEIAAYQERIFLELLVEQDPLVRCRWFDSPEAAIEAFREDFDG